MERLTEKDQYSQDYKIQAKNLNSHCVAIDAKGYMTYYGQHIDKLAEYENLEEQGRLIKLPCKVGDTIYGLHKAMVCELNTETIGISKMPSGEILYLIDGWELDKGDFGKTVFLTKSEAEAKLKELRGGENER